MYLSDLSLSSSSGDLLFKHPDFTKGKPSGLSAEPDVVDIVLEPKDQFLVLACDGLSAVSALPPWFLLTHRRPQAFGT